MANLLLAQASAVTTIAIMLLWLKLICLAAAADPGIAWDWDNSSQPISIFRSRPDLLAPVLTPLEGIHQREKMAPGYFFVSPYGNMQEAIYMYDNNADLVYTSFGSYGAAVSHAPRVCQYHGQTHLCFYQGVQHVGWGHGHGVIMDQNYRMVRSIEPSCTYQASSDMHEFYLSQDGTTAFMSQYIRSVYDLCPWGLCDGLGYIQAGYFQEVDVDSGNCLFYWNSLEHIDPSESLVMPSSTEISGSGESPEMPWDYFHINSIDKSSLDGGYLVSARHTCAIYKVDGETGDIIWRLGGTKNDFEYDNELGDINFGFQHDARWISDNEDESVISVYDNASNGFTETARISTGKIIRLDHRKKVARLVEKPIEPPWVDGHAHLSKSQGNFQLNLPGAKIGDVGGQQIGKEIGNRIMGFGNDAFFAEYAWSVTKNEETGQEVGEWEKVFYGALAYGFMMNYRVLKFDSWEGVPLTKPALWSFSQYGLNHTDDNSNAMMLYVSWNGHTKIDTYMFYGANTAHARRDTNSRDWAVLIGGFRKAGFETIYRHPKTYRYTYVEAFDKNGRTLGKSLVQDTFTPNPLMASHYCDELACTWMDTNNPDREQMREKMAEVYQNWTNAKENTTGTEIEDVFRSSYNPSGDLKPGRGAKIFGFAISFFALGMLFFAMFALAMRRYISVQRYLDKIVTLFGLQPRRWEESWKGKYSSVNSSGVDLEEDDSEMQRVASRSSDHDFGEFKKELGLDAERQAFSRTRSP